MPKVKFKDLCKLMLKGKESTDKQLTNDSSEWIYPLKKSIALQHTSVQLFHISVQLFKANNRKSQLNDIQTLSW
jgi:hypothetical protein